MVQRNSKKNKLERNLEKDSKGKPRVSLKELKEKVVNTTTQKDYDTLMRVYECGGWKWMDKELPTKSDIWIWYQEETCIHVENKFTYCSKESYQKEEDLIITIQKFYDKQKITPNVIEEINNYFEAKK